MKRLAIILLLILSVQTLSAQTKKAAKAYAAAEEAFFNKDYDLAQKELDKALDYDPNYCHSWLLQGDLALIKGDYKKSVSAYEHALSIDPNIRIGKEFELAKFRNKMQENPVPFDPQNLGSQVNTSDDEYINMVIFDGSKILLTRRIHSKNTFDEESLFQSVWQDGQWQVPQLFELPYLQSNCIGAAYCSPDGQNLYFSYNDGDPHGSRDIYSSIAENGDWAVPKKVSNINSNSWESQPCLSPDGKELFFTRRVKGYSQILYCTRDSIGASWSQPVRLDTIINKTDGNQMAPFLHPDGKTLYFSSDRLMGMGGYDIFMSQRNANGQWSQPVNLGYPINTECDEINFYVAPDGKTAFISSQREGGFGGYDIYTFELDESLRPEAVTYFGGEVVELNVYPVEINAGDTLTIKNIQFEFNSSSLTADSKAGIEKIAELLQSHPEFNAELAGHTDNVGNENYNQILSAERANAVRDALINIGVDAKRLTAKGYGSSKPIAPNDSEENKAKNRRTELIILK